jgi:hypothetical protein|tara:strand:+ start:37 stop:675 length:639 start_codon:yes stop_codon:yes gene_type:complete
MSDPFDTYGEDIAGQSYASFGETRGDSGGGDNNEDSVKRTTIRTTDPTVGFDREPPPSERLNLISRIGGGAIQGIKDYFGDPSNRTGIVSSLIGTALLGPLAGLISGVVGQKFGARDNLLQGINTIELDDNFLMPRNVPVNIKRDIPNFPPDMNLYAKVVGPALTQMRTLEKAKELERFGGERLTEEEQKTLDKLKEMDADPNKIYSLPVIV